MPLFIAIRKNKKSSRLGKLQNNFYFLLIVLFFSLKGTELPAQSKDSQLSSNSCRQILISKSTTITESQVKQQTEAENLQLILIRKNISALARLRVQIDAIIFATTSTTTTTISEISRNKLNIANKLNKDFINKMEDLLHLANKYGFSKNFIYSELKKEIELITQSSLNAPASNFKKEQELFSTMKAFIPTFIGSYQHKNETINEEHFSPDGKSIVLSSWTFPSFAGIARIIDISTSKVIQEVKHRRKIIAAFHSFDGKYFITGSVDGVIKVTKLITLEDSLALEPISQKKQGQTTKTQEETISFRHKEQQLKTLNLSNDGELLVSGDELGHMKIISTKTWKTYLSMNIDSFSDLKFSPDNKYLFAGLSNEGQLFAIDIAKKKKIDILKNRQQTLKDIKISPDGKYLVVSGSDNFMKIIEIGTWTLHYFIKFEGSPSHFIFSSDGNYLIITSDKVTRVEDIKNKKEVFKIQHESRINNTLLSPNGKYLFTGSSDHTVKITDFLTGELKYTIPHDEQVLRLFITPDSNYLISFTQNSFYKITDLNNSFKEFNNYQQTDRIYISNISPDGKYLLSTSLDEKTEIFQLYFTVNQ